MTEYGIQSGRTLLTLAILCLSATAQQQRTVTGKVVAIVDGDTLTILDVDKRERKVRLGGIDAPESTQSFSDKARRSLSELVRGKRVTVTISKTEESGIIVGKVTRDGRDINLEQVRRGFAWFYRNYTDELSQIEAKVYELAETEAREKGRGLWAEPGPIPPWELRAAQGAR